MKHLHFFGCSFTVGDELSDDVWFPWKHECTSSEEYYSRRNLHLGILNIQYQEDNKKKAYPARLQSDEYKTYNYSNNGESLRTCIFRALGLIFCNESIDAIFIQIPPPGRELYIHDGGNVSSIQMSKLRHSLEPITTYLKAKLNSHTTEQAVAEECMDMIMLANLAKQKNIPLYFLDIGKDIIVRMQDLTYHELNFLKTNLRKEINLISFLDILKKAEQEGRILTGGHLDVKAHQEMADQLKNLLPNILKQ